MLSLCATPRIICGRTIIVIIILTVESLNLLAQNNTAKSHETLAGLFEFDFRDSVGSSSVTIGSELGENRIKLPHNSGIMRVVNRTDGMSVYLDSVKFRNNNWVKAAGKRVSLFLKDCEADSIIIAVDSLILQRSQFNYLDFGPIVLTRYVNIMGCSIKHIRGNYRQFSSFSVATTHIGRLDLDGVALEQTFGTYMSKIDTINISDVRLLNDAWISLQTIGNKFELSVYATDLKKIRTGDYRKFHLYVPRKRYTWDQVNSVYLGFLEKFTSEGRLSSYALLDKEYKAEKYLHNYPLAGRLYNWVDRWWWDYGYNKILVFKNSLTIFMFFVVVNFVWFKVFTNAYQVPDFRRALPYKRRLFRRIVYALLFSGFIFFGFTLHHDKIKFDNPIAVCVILLQYGIGLVCVAFIANWIVS